MPSSGLSVPFFDTFFCIYQTVYRSKFSFALAITIHDSTRDFSLSKTSVVNGLTYFCAIFAMDCFIMHLLTIQLISWFENYGFFEDIRNRDTLIDFFSEFSFTQPSKLLLPETEASWLLQVCRVCFRIILSCIYEKLDCLINRLGVQKLPFKRYPAYVEAYRVLTNDGY